MNIGPRDAQWMLKPIKNLLMTIDFPSFFLDFDIFININEYANEIIFFRPMTSINMLYDIPGSIKCHKDSLSILWIFCHF